MVRLCGTSLGLFAFFVAIVQGLLAGNPAEVTLLRAIYALIIFCLLGLVTGWVAFRVLDEHALHKHREMFPEPSQEHPTADPAVVATDDGAAGPARGATGQATAR